MSSIHAASKKSALVDAPAPLSVDWYRLAKVTQALLALNAVVALVFIAADVVIAIQSAELARDADSATSAQLARLDSLVALISFRTIWVYALPPAMAAAPFVLWLARAHRSDRMDARRLAYDSSWSVTCWFRLGLFLNRPYQIVNDVRRGAGSGAGGTGLVTAWWVSWALVAPTLALTKFFWQVPVSGGDRGQRLVDIQHAAYADGVGNGLLLASAFLALVVVTDVTDLVRRSPRGLRHGKERDDVAAVITADLARRRG
jgi:hypothetical protein